MTSGLKAARRALGPKRYTRSEKALARAVLLDIPVVQLQAVSTRHSGVERHHKYTNVEQQTQRAARQATDLGLHKATPLRVLDLGCGAGYFLAVARHLGHDVVGLDLADSAVFNDFITVLDIPRVEHTIAPDTRLPDLGAPFDLVTSHAAKFNWTARDVGWTADEWITFLDDCRSKLASDGRARFVLNPGKNPSYRFLPDDTLATLRRLPGVQISRNKRVLTLRADRAARSSS